MLMQSTHLRSTFEDYNTKLNDSKFSESLKNLPTEEDCMEFGPGTFIEVPASSNCSSAKTKNLSSNILTDILTEKTLKSPAFTIAEAAGLSSTALAGIKVSGLQGKYWDDKASFLEKYTLFE